MVISEKQVSIKNGHHVVLRSPKPQDAEVLLKHLRSVFHESYRNMNHPADYFDSFSTEKEAQILEDFSTSKDKFMISAFRGDRIVGNLGIFGSGGAFLKFNARLGMGIEKEYQNQGLGSEMIQYALAMSKKNGFHRIELTVRTYNQAGISLYEKSGFQRVGLLKDIAYIENSYCDEYLYQLIL